jgi:hypothetical protein
MQATTWNPGLEVERRKPDAQVLFSEGDYEHALRCYYTAKAWVLDTGQCFRQDLVGYIRSPQHPESPSERSAFVPEELIAKPGWYCTIDLYVAGAATLDYLKSLELPEGARLQISIKVFNMDDCTWIAAANLEDAWRGFAEFMGYDTTTPHGVEEARKDNPGFEPEELTDADLDRLMFHHSHDLSDPCPSGDRGQEDTDCPISFRQQLERMKQAGATFPSFFATTEY